MGGDVPPEDIFLNQGQLNTEKRLKHKEQKAREKELAKWEFPRHVSSHHDFTNPALEYSKMVCEHIFGLD